MERRRKLMVLMAAFSSVAALWLLSVIFTVRVGIGRSTIAHCPLVLGSGVCRTTNPYACIGREQEVSSGRSENCFDCDWKARYCYGLLVMKMKY